MGRILSFTVLTGAYFFGIASAKEPGASAHAHTTPEWVTRSDQNAKLLLEVDARFYPASAASLGISDLDEQTIDLKPKFEERHGESTKQAIIELEKRLEQEKDNSVRQDLDILIKGARSEIRRREIRKKHFIQFYDANEIAYWGIEALLDDQVPLERRMKALVHRRKYAGMEPGYEPLTKLCEDRMRERLNVPGVLGPFKGWVERNLSNSDTHASAIAKLFDKYHIAGYEPTYRTLRAQLAKFNEFVRRKILPRTRTDYRMPPEVYAYTLERVGVDMPPEQLAVLAHASFDEIQNEMMALAPRVAKEKGIQATDYRDVIRALKKEQWEGPEILANYEKRMAEIEDIIKQARLVSLPSRPVKIKLAREAESAHIPGPNLVPPPRINNTGETGVFVLPLRVPAPAGAKPDTTERLDDYTFAAISWTLAAHEGRPGHDLQFDAMLEKGVSLARSEFASNSVNIEGWALYSEAILQPYMPLDGQLVSLQQRLMRAARAFLDPELQAGKITTEEAKKLLMEDVVLSETLANQEVDRYTFRQPGQATSYFYGYTRLMRLRADTEEAMGSQFDQLKFHDFILSLGTLPPDLLREAVIEHFVPQSTPADTPFLQGLDVSINGSVPLHFGLDTGGAADFFIIPEKAQQLGLPVTGHRMIHTSDRQADGAGDWADIVRATTLGVAGHTFAEPEGVVLRNSRHGSRADADGTPGITLFRDVLLTLDYSHDRLMISDGALPLPNGRDIIPYTTNPNTAFRPLRVSPTVKI